MEDFKLNALNKFFSDRKLSYHFASSDQLRYQLININNIIIYARLADTPELTQKGLMGVDKLGNNEGCLLCFGYQSPASLWMKNCKINLQAAAIDKTGKITDILNMDYKDPYRIHRSSSCVTHVLEMSENFFTKNNISVGSTVRFL